MTVVGLHPEELFDKLLEGELTPAEHARLRAHLDSCEVCRFEHAARRDFQQEALTLASASPPLMPLGAPQVAAVPARRRRSRRLVWGMAAAAVITASGAVASVVAGQAPWRAMSLLFSRAAAPSEPTSGTRAKQPARASVLGPVAAMPAQAALPPVAAEPQPVLPAAVGRGGKLGASLAARPARVAAPKVPSASAEAAAKDTATSAASEPVAKEPAPAARLFAEANQARRSGDIGRASGLYHLLQDQFPGSAEAELSRVTLALLLLDSGDAQSALTGFERYLAGSSRGLEAEALVGRARALGRLGRRDLEATAWQEVQRKYPRSIYGRQASERLLALGQP